MKPILMIDFGSTNTKVTAVDLEEGKLLGTAASYTTVQTDINDGLENALAKLHEKLGGELQTPPVATLRKVRHNKQQSRITGYAQRKANVLGAYEVINPATVAGKRILLLDDILTTGATAGECARILLTAGAKEVKFAAIAAARQHKKDRR